MIMRNNWFTYLVLGLIFSLNAAADRVVSESVSVFATADSNEDAFVTVHIHNPSTVDQTVAVEIVSTGSYELVNANRVIGSGLVNCASNVCSLRNTSQTIAPDMNRTFGVRVRKTVGGGYDDDTGAHVKFTVTGDTGHLKASINVYQELFNGVAYYGGPQAVNGGRPF